MEAYRYEWRGTHWRVTGEGGEFVGTIEYARRGYAAKVGGVTAHGRSKEQALGNAIAASERRVS